MGLSLGAHHVSPRAPVIWDRTKGFIDQLVNDAFSSTEELPALQARTSIDQAVTTESIEVVMREYSSPTKEPPSPPSAKPTPHLVTFTVTETETRIQTRIREIKGEPAAGTVSSVISPETLTKTVTKTVKAMTTVLTTTKIVNLTSVQTVMATCPRDTDIPVKQEVGGTAWSLAGCFYVLRLVLSFVLLNVFCRWLVLILGTGYTVWDKSGLENHFGDHGLQLWNGKSAGVEVDMQSVSVQTEQKRRSRRASI